MEAALAFVVSAAENPGDRQEVGASGDADDSGYDAKAVQELVEWRKRLGEETSDLDPGGAVDGTRLVALRKGTAFWADTLVMFLVDRQCALLRKQRKNRDDFRKRVPRIAIAGITCSRESRVQPFSVLY